MRRSHMIAGLLLSVFAAACNDNGDTRVPAGQPELLFQLDAASVDQHPFPNDDYLDRSFVVGNGVPILATSIVQKAFGVPVDNADGGFTPSQSKEMFFLSQLGLGSATAYSPTSTVRIPFSSGPSINRILGETTVNAVKIFDLGAPSYTASVAPPFTPFAVPSLSANPSVGVNVPLTEFRINPNTNALTVRPRVPFQTSLPTAANQLGLRTYGVVVLTNQILTSKGQFMKVSRQYAAIQKSNNGELTGTAADNGLADATELARVNRYIRETKDGFAKLPGIKREDTLAYFQFTVRNDTLDMQVINGTVFGAFPVNDSGLLSDTTTSNTLNVGTGAKNLRFDTTGLVSRTTSSTPSIADFFNTAYGPAAGSSAVVSFDATTGRSTLVDLNARFNLGYFSGGSLNPNTAQGLTFPVLTNDTVTITVAGDITGVASAGNPYSLTGPRATGSTVPQGKILRVVSGRVNTPSFVSSILVPRLTPTGVPDDDQSLFFTNQTFLSNRVLPTASGSRPFPFVPTERLRQFGLKSIEYHAVIPVGATGATPITLLLHGVGSSKEAMLLLAAELAEEGVISIMIDHYQHGLRQTDTAVNAAHPTTLESPLSKALLVTTDPSTGQLVSMTGVDKAPEGSFARRFDPLVETLSIAAAQGGPNPPALASGTFFPDPFINPTFHARTRDKSRQTLVDNLTVLRLLVSAGTSVAAATFDPLLGPITVPQIRIAGQSLGGIYTTTLTSLFPLASRAVINVGGGALPDLLSDSPSQSPNLDLLLNATAAADDGNAAAAFVLLVGTDRQMARGNENRDILNITLATSLSGSFEALTFSQNLLAPSLATGSLRRNPQNQAVALPPAAILMQFALNDQTINNPANVRLAAGVAHAEPYADSANTTPLTTLSVVGPQLFPILGEGGNLPSLGFPASNFGIAQFPGTHSSITSTTDPTGPAVRKQAARFLGRASATISE